MKRKITFLTAALALLLMICLPGKIWADHVTFTATDYTGQGTQSSGSSVTMVKTALSITNTKFYGNTSHAHLYANGVSTITPASGVTITQLVLTATEAGYNGYQSGGNITASTGEMSHNETTVTWTGSATSAFTISNTKQIRWTSIVATYTTSGGNQPTTFTVTYHANGGTGNDIVETYNEGVDVTVAANTFSYSGHAFTKWNTNSGGTGTDYLPGAVIEDIDDDWDFYAQWEESNETTATLTATNLSLPTGNSYNDNETEVVVDGITYAYNKLKDNNGNIQAQATYGNIRNTTAYPGDITSVVITHTSTARATTINGSADGTNWTQVATGSGSINADFSGKGYKYFQITRGSNAAYWEKIDITYSANASTQSQSDLTITNTSTNLTFDLYDNATAQVINYTTSSTGTITITPETSTYFSYVHDATYKTITVTPLAKTPGPQTVTISQAADDDYYAGTATFTVSVTNNVPANLPFAFDGGKAAIEETDGLTHQGLGTDYTSSPHLKFDTQNDNLVLKINEAPGVLKFDIMGTGNSWTGTFDVQTSIDGQTYTNVATYTDNLGETETKTLGNLASNVRYIRWYFTSKDSGCNVGVGNIHLNPQAAITLNSYSIAANAEVTTGSLTVTYTGIETDYATPNIYWFESDGVNFAYTAPDWISASINNQGNVEYHIDENEDVARTAYFKVLGYDAAEHPVYSDLVTVTQEGVPAMVYYTYSINGYEVYNQYTEYVGTTLDLESGDDLYSYEVDFAFAGWTLDPSDVVNRITQYTFTENDVNHTVTFYAVYSHPTTAGGTAYYTRVFLGESFVGLDGNEIVGPSIIPSGYFLDVNGLINANADWLIVEDGGQLITDDVVEATIQKNIQAYTITANDETDPDNVILSNGWYFISSPLNGEVDPANGNTNDQYVVNLIASPAANYDLYLFDYTGEVYGQGGKEWVNYKAHTDLFGLQNGHGYLYANANDVTLEFVGSVNYCEEVSLDNTGWNLVGNPWAYDAYPSMSYYMMNADGTGIDATEYIGYPVPPCTGILVNSDEGSITFSKDPDPDEANHGNIQMVLAQTVTTRGESSSQTLDNAIVSFNEGSKLGKFYFGTQNANLYIPQGTKEYAIVSSEGQGEMPVNFRANENGQYTLTVNPENVEMNYLHLIDNMTGMDVDLLAEPSYTFAAKTTDYESRFKLVFFANTAIEDNSNETFAFFSDGQLIVNGEGTLQIFDALGRQLMCKQLSTLNCQLSTVNYSPGVYMLRLVNGDNVKVQKVVVR